MPCKACFVLPPLVCGHTPGQIASTCVTSVSFEIPFAHSQRSTDDRPLILIAMIGGEMKVLFFHTHPQARVSDCAAPADQIDDQHHHRYNEQQMDQATRHVQAETQKPQNQKYYENCPKHD